MITFFLKFLNYKVFTFLLAFTFMNCGYTWQSRQNKWKASQIESIYIKTIVNNSLRAGAEVTFRSALIKKFAGNPRVKLVSQSTLADATLEATLASITSQDTGADTTVTAITNDSATSSLKDFLIATQYSASALLRVSLVRNRDGATLWKSSFAGSRLYQGNNRFGLQGTTSVLINDTDLQVALNQVADTIAADVYDAMFEVY